MVKVHPSPDRDTHADADAHAHAGTHADAPTPTPTPTSRPTATPAPTADARADGDTDTGRHADPTPLRAHRHAVGDAVAPPVGFTPTSVANARVALRGRAVGGAVTGPSVLGPATGPGSPPRVRLRRLAWAARPAELDRRLARRRPRPRPAGSSRLGSVPGLVLDDARPARPLAVRSSCWAGPPGCRSSGAGWATSAFGSASPAAADTVRGRVPWGGSRTVRSRPGADRRLTPPQTRPRLRATTEYGP